MGGWGKERHDWAGGGRREGGSACLLSCRLCSLVQCPRVEARSEAPPTAGNGAEGTKGGTAFAMFRQLLVRGAASWGVVW